MNLENCHLDHVAIAVTSIHEAQKIYEQIGFSFNSHIEEVPSQKVKVAFAKIDHHAQIELLESTSEESSVAKFIAKNGPGLHHLCFQVESIEEKQKEMQAQGIKFIYEKPFIGAHNCLVNFIHPKSTGGVLIELSQKVENDVSKTT